MKESTNSIDQKQPLLTSTDARKFPQVFKWKLAAIIITVLTAIFVVVNVILYVHYEDNQPRKNNYTFMTDLVSSLSTTTINTAQFVNAMTGLSFSYYKLWFQNAVLLQSTSTLSLPTVASIFNKDRDTDRLLSFVAFTDANDKQYLGVFYTHIAFPLDLSVYEQFLNKKETNQYYTFEIENRQSVLLGGGNPSFLKMDNNMDNLLNCKILRLSATKLTFLQTFSLTYGTDKKAQINTVPQNSIICFIGPTNQQLFMQQVYEILGISAADTASLKMKSLNIFHLND